MKESYDCDCGICSICTGVRRPNESHDSARIRQKIGHEQFKKFYEQ
jgi:hypothetical protein